MNSKIDTSREPKDWTINGKEASLSNVYTYFERFIDDPNYHNKEMLLTLVNQDDLNETNDLGIYRVTDYEIMLINSIYLYSKVIGCTDGVLYIYRLLIRSFIMRKMYFMTVEQDNYNFEYIMTNDDYMDGLLPELKFFYYIYAIFRWDKDKTFAECLIQNMWDLYKTVTDEEANDIFRMFNILVYDLSFNNSTYLLSIAEFSREEIIEIFNIQSKYANRLKINPLNRPLKGVMCISVANWLLKSRDGYNQDVIYKCIWSNDIISAASNMQLWMKKTKYLNDENEGCISTNILSTINEWRNYEWMEDKNYQYAISYVSSFCKTKPNDYMLENYGDCWIGFKNDKIASSISPIQISINNGKPFFSQVFSYDVCYDEDVFKDEINIVGKIVDKFNLSNEEKNNLFNSIIHYWRYSIKESKWSIERERRYQIFLSENYNYVDLEIDEKFLKVKTYLTMCPDFCYITNYCKNLIKENKKRKMSIYSKPYYFCEECLYHNFDELDFGANKQRKCPICGSINYYKRNTD